MPEYLAPGVYVEETSFRPKTIEGVSTSTAGFVGPARFGPIEGVPELLTSFTDFERTYGGIDRLGFSEDGRISLTDNYLAHAVRAYFENGGKRLYVSRVYSPISDKDNGRAKCSIGTGNIELFARYPGEYGNMTVDFFFKVGQNIIGKDRDRTVLRGASEYDLILLKTEEIENKLFWLEFDKEKNTYQLRTTNPSDEEGLLFTWNKIPGDDSDKLIELLLRNHKIDWVTPALIEKKTDFSSIKVYDKDNIIELTLNAAKTAVTLSPGGKVDTLEAKEENGTVNIYEKKSLFDWNKIPGDDNEKFLEFMKQELHIDWTNDVKIPNKDGANPNKIDVVLDTHPVILNLDPGNKKLSITIDGGAANEFDVDVNNAVYKNELLFDWSKIQTDNRENTILKDYLKKNYDKDWVDNASIENSGTIEAIKDPKSFKLSLNANKTKAILRIDGIQSGLYNARIINNELNICKDNLFVTDITDPSKTEARIVTVNVTIDMPGKFSSPSTFEKLSLHPDHKKSLGKVFPESPNDRSTELYVPLVFNTELQNGVAIAEVLLNELNIYGTAKVRDKYLDPNLKDSDKTIRKVLTGGNDGQRPTATAYEGSEDKDSEKILKSGLRTFEDIEDISIVAAPGSSSDKKQVQTILGHLITHCEKMRYRIAVLDSADKQALSEIRKYRGQLDSKHAALYYPWVTILDPLTNEKLNLPPSGFVAGIYARNDVEYGVHKAPANEVVKLAIGFDVMLNKAQQDVLNPEAINCFRFFEGRGYRLWGARTITSDPEWKYVNLRRYFAYLERSIDKGTQWVVFENNSERLWANVKSTVEDFLFSEWKSGHLMGESAKEAYFVRCDRSTMTQNDIDNGRLICLVGVAPVRPAEFVIFRIGQKLLDTKT